MFSPCPFICMFVSRITQKLLNKNLGGGDSINYRVDSDKGTDPGISHHSTLLLIPQRVMHQPCQK